MIAQVNFIRSDKNFEEQERETMTILQILRRWKKNLHHSGKVHSEHFDQDATLLKQFLDTHTDKRLNVLLHVCMEAVRTENFRSTKLQDKVQQAITLVQDTCTKERRNAGLNVDYGQRHRYASLSKRLYAEKLRFKNNDSLREADLTLMEHKDARKVRRIVEKRMCQAYHRKHKSDDEYNLSSRKRHEMDRAVSYEIYNLGQLDGKTHQRQSGSHWKKKVDAATGELIMQKKKSYNSMDEAFREVQNYLFRHPEDKRDMSVYLCAHCQKFHIGHQRRKANALPSVAIQGNGHLYRTYP